MFAVMRETNAIVILRSKAAHLRQKTGNPSLHAINDKAVPVRHLLIGSLLRPGNILVRSPIVLASALFLALMQGVVMLLFATFPTFFEQTYHWNVAISGLSYPGIGVGATTGIIIFSMLSDALLRDAGDGAAPERRLLLTMWACPTVIISQFAYGWSTYYQVHWIVPIIGTGIGGLGMVIIISSAKTYIIDVFGPQGAASAIAAATLLRNALAAFLPLATPSLYSKLGLG
jgi:hypothetical protein